MTWFSKNIIIILLTIFCYVNALAIHASHGIKNNKGNRQYVLRSARSKRDKTEADVHSLISETNSLASAAESIQAAENSLAAGVEAEKSRKALPSRVAKSVVSSANPPEPRIREFIPDGPRNDIDYYDDYYDDYNYDDYYYDSPSYRRTQNQQALNRPSHLSLKNQNTQLRVESKPEQKLNSNKNTQYSSILDLRQNPNIVEKDEINLKKVYWLKLPDKLPDQNVHQKVDALFGEVSGDGKDVLVIPISREYTSPDDVSDGFMKAMGLHSALRRARRLRRLKMDVKKI